MRTHIEAKTITAQDFWCVGCEVDHDLPRLPKAEREEEMKKRKRLALTVGGTTLTLCPNCAARIRGEVFPFLLDAHRASRIAEGTRT